MPLPWLLRISPDKPTSYISFMDFSCLSDFLRMHLTFFDFFDFLVAEQKSKFFRKAQKAPKSHKSQEKYFVNFLMLGSR